MKKTLIVVAIIFGGYSIVQWLRSSDSWDRCDYFRRENELVIVWQLSRFLPGLPNGFDTNPATITYLNQDASRFQFDQKRTGKLIESERFQLASGVKLGDQFRIWISQDRIAHLGCRGNEDNRDDGARCHGLRSNKQIVNQIGSRTEEMWLVNRNIVVPQSNQTDCVVPLPNTIRAQTDERGYLGFRAAFFPSKKLLYIVGNKDEKDVLYVSNECQAFERLDYSNFAGIVEKKYDLCPNGLQVQDIAPANHFDSPILMVDCGGWNVGVMNLATASHVPLPKSQYQFFLDNDGTKIVKKIDSESVDDSDGSKQLTTIKYFNLQTKLEEQIQAAYQPRKQ